MKTYRIKTCRSCRNCKHVFAVSRQDDPTSLYCNFDKTVPRFNADKNNYWPKDFLLKKHISKKLLKKTEKLVFSRMTEWDLWTQHHLVDFCGFCNNHSLKTKCLEN